MSLIKCPECEKTISEKSKFCVFCGYPFEDTDITKMANSNKKKKIKIKPFYIISALIIGIITFLFLFYLSNQTTLEEKYAINNTEKLLGILKDPNSLEIYEDILVIQHYSDMENYNGFYTYISYGAKNGYGGMARDIAIFKGYEYIASWNEIEEYIESTPTTSVEIQDLVNFTANEDHRYPYYQFVLDADDDSILFAEYVSKDYVMKKVK